MNQPLTVDLDQRFGIPGIAQVVAGNGGLARVVIDTGETAGEIYLHGAHVTSWLPRDEQEVLFLSSRSRWEPDHPIRGGIPICFPWFGDKGGNPQAPAHGLVRAIPWQLDAIVQCANSVAVMLYVTSNAETKRWWPHDFHLAYHVTLGSELRLELRVMNTGTKPFQFEEALHSYFQVGQIEQVRIHGLDTVQYLDKTDAFRAKIQHGPLAISSQTDRVFLDTMAPVDVEDLSVGRRIRIAKENSRATVVWNPWIEKARALSDLGDDEWQRMVCVETCNVAGDAVELAPGREHRMEAVITLAPR